MVKAKEVFLLVVRGISSCNFTLNTAQHYPHAPELTQSVHSIDDGGAASHSHHLVVLVNTEAQTTVTAIENVTTVLYVYCASIPFKLPLRAKQSFIELN